MGAQIWKHVVKDPTPPMAFSVPKRNRKLWCGEGEEEEGGGENVHLLTHTTARGVGKNVIEKVGVIYLNNYEKKISDHRDILKPPFLSSEKILCIYQKIFLPIDHHAKFKMFKLSFHGSN